MMMYLSILRYCPVILSSLAINIIVYMISPGNWILATISSFLVIMVLLPVGNSQSTNSDGTRSPVTFSDLAQFLDQQNEGEDDGDYHSSLGNVFNTMARNAARDLYSSEITGTNGKFQEKKRNNEDTKAIQSSFSPRKEILHERLEHQELVVENSADGEKIEDNHGIEPETIKLEVDNDGKLHYIFQGRNNEYHRSNIEEETILGDSRFSPPPNEIESMKLMLTMRLKNINVLYALKLQQGADKGRERLQAILVGHLERLQAIISHVDRVAELEGIEEVLSPFESLLLNWLLEERGLLYSHKPDNLMSEIVRKVKLPSREELDHGQLSNYLGKLTSIIRFLSCTAAYGWLLELHGTVNAIKVPSSHGETDSLKEIKDEMVGFLGECVSHLLDPDPETSEHPVDYDQLGGYEV